MRRPLYHRTGAMKRYLFLTLLAVTSACCRPTRPVIDVWTAAATGEAGLIQQHIEAGTDIDEPNRLTRSTPLNMAIAFGHASTARALVEGGANIEGRNGDGATPLIVATFFGHEEIVRMLVHAGANLDARNQLGMTALQVAEAEWSRELEGLYKFMGRLMRTELDLEDIKASRPGIVAVLRAAGGE